jgi:hypothetical protein
MQDATGLSHRIWLDPKQDIRFKGLSVKALTQG